MCKELMFKKEKKAEQFCKEICERDNEKQLFQQRSTSIVLLLKTDF